MQAFATCIRRRCAWCACALGVAGLAAGLYGALPGRTLDPAKELSGDRRASTQLRGFIVGGTGIPAGLDIPVAAPVYAYKAKSGRFAAEERPADDETKDLDLPSDAVAYRVGTPCDRDIDCEDCDPCTRDRCRPGTCSAGSDTPGFPCSADLHCPGGTCEFFAPAGKQCVRVFEPTGEAGECSDGYTCNGREFCDANHQCVAGPACDNVGDVCNPTLIANGLVGACAAPCSAGGCSDSNACNGTESCDTGTTLCVTTPAPCGEGAPCVEGNPVTCGFGRCCDNTAPIDPTDCTRTTRASCPAGKTWLGVGDRASTPADDNTCDEPAGQQDPFEGEDFQCPRYAAGVSPRGTLTTQVGPASAAACEPVREIGDDYTIQLDTPGNFLEVTTFRFIGGYRPGTGDRMHISFYDANGVFIEDTIADEDRTTVGIALRTIIFAEKPVVPQNGYVTIRPATQFSPDGQAFWMATDAVDVGSNDAGKMWVNGAVANNYIAGQPDILAFEIVGNEQGPPLGACCVTASGACELQFSWLCELAGNVPQGIGTLCGVCDGDDFTQCDEDADCNIVGGPCVPFLPACTNTACCNNTTGACSSVQGGTCSVGGAPCLNDSQCVSGTCEAQCPGGTTGQGFGSSCNPDCCPRPTYTGADNCEDVTALALIINPDPNITVTKATSGDNSPATFPDSCTMSFLGPIGPGQTDQGWWESFTIDKCANVRVDLCCTDPIHIPQWPFLIKECPCETTQPMEPVPSPVGILTAARARGAPFCPDDNFWVTFGPLPAGQYWFPIYTDDDGHIGPYQLHVTAAACPTAACCIGTPVCQQPDGSLELSGGAVVRCPGGTECAGGNTCVSDCIALNEPNCTAVNGYWLGFRNIPTGANPVVDCTASPCAIGSCCEGTDCRDRSNPSVPCDPGTPSTCMDETLCLSLPGRFVGGARCDYPTPACTACEIEATDKCQVKAGGDEWEFGTLSDLAAGLRAADDFKPSGTSISTVCITGQYLSMDPTATTVKCAATSDVVDEFHVRVFANNAATNLPGTLIGESPATVALKGLDSFTDYLEWHKLQLVLDSPIAGLTPGACHWIEITNNTALPANNQCRFYWASHVPEGGTHDGNQYSAVAAASDTTYALGGYRNIDHVFCLDIPFDAGGCGGFVGACCACDGSSCGELELTGCSAASREWHSEEPDCSGITCSGDPPPGDSCVDPIPATDGTYLYHSQCADTDGPTEVRSEVEQGATFSKDIWYEYTATCTGTVVVSQCGSSMSYDGFIAVYRNKPNLTPPFNNPKVCTCPTGNSTLFADAGSDEQCHRGFVGPGFVRGRVDFGDCLLVRAGGYGGAGGDGSVTIQCAEATCVQSLAPVAATGVTAGGAQAISTRNRFLSFSGGDPGRNQAIRVKFRTLPAPWNVWNGTTAWVQLPVDVCETAGVGPGGACAAGVPTFKWAKLNCASPLYKQWSGDGVINVSHPGIVPNGIYDIQLIDESCPTNDESAYSPALVMTNAKWGDTVGPFRAASNAWTIPDNTVSITADVTAGLNKFGNRPGSPQKVRADVEPCSVDLKINITDVTRVLDAFRNLPFPFSPTGGFGCNNADPCSYSAEAELAVTAPELSPK